MLGTPYEEWRKRAVRRERPRTTTDEKVQLLEDKRRIEELICEYGIACDSQGWDTLQEIYDENIEREMTGTLAEARELLDLVRAKNIAPPPISERALDQASTTLDDLRAGKIVGRVVLTA